MADVYDGGVSLNVMSKAYGLPGLRIGWIACRDHRLLARMERLKHYLSICNSAPAEILARIALKASDSILGRNRDIIRGNLGLLEEFFDEFADLFEWSVPDGGCIGYPRYLGKEGVDHFFGQRHRQRQRGKHHRLHWLRTRLGRHGDGRRVDVDQ